MGIPERRGEHCVRVRSHLPCESRVHFKWCIFHAASDPLAPAGRAKVGVSGGKGLFLNSQTRPLHANEGNQTTRHCVRERSHLPAVLFVLFVLFVLSQEDLRILPADTVAKRQRVRKFRLPTHAYWCRYGAPPCLPKGAAPKRAKVGVRGFHGLGAGGSGRQSERYYAHDFTCATAKTALVVIRTVRAGVLPGKRQEAWRQRGQDTPHLAASARNPPAPPAAPHRSHTLGTPSETRPPPPLSPCSLSLCVFLRVHPGTELPLLVCLQNPRGTERYLLRGSVLLTMDNGAQEKRSGFTGEDS